MLESPLLGNNCWVLCKNSKEHVTRRSHANRNQHHDVDLLRLRALPGVRCDYEGDEVMAVTEISDDEFERCLETVFEMWDDQRDTVDIANKCGITEAQAEAILTCVIESKMDMKYDAKMALQHHFKNKNWAAEIIDQIEEEA